MRYCAFIVNEYFVYLITIVYNCLQLLEDKTNMKTAKSIECVEKFLQICHQFASTHYLKYVFM